MLILLDFIYNYLNYTNTKKKLPLILKKFQCQMQVSN